MRKDVFIFAAGAVLTALSVIFPGSTLLWDVVFWAGIAAMAGSVIHHLARGRRPVMALAGTVVFALASLGCLVWYLWPATSTVQPAISQEKAGEECSDLYDAAGGFDVGYVPSPTPFASFTSKELIDRISTIGRELESAEDLYHDAMRTIASRFQPHSGMSEEELGLQFNNATNEKAAVEHKRQDVFGKYLSQIRSLHDELIIRLRLPFPRCSKSSGLTLDAYKALMTGSVYGPLAMHDLSRYLKSLAARL